MSAITIPLDSIVGHSPLNVRSEADAGDTGAMAASILALGLLQPLLIRDDGHGWEVLDGGRRFAALRSLVLTGRLPADYRVPIIVDNSDTTTAVEASLAANVVRHELHPVEAFEAFASLVNRGVTPEQIATDFNVSTRFVRQRLTLNRLSPAVRDLWRRGEISADAAEAFTAAPSYAAQDAFLQDEATKGWRRHAPSIRHHFTKAAKKANSPEALYVGLGAYQAAGGAVDDNLFEDFSLCLDGALLDRLARAKMQTEGEALLERYGYGFLAFRADVDRPWDWTRLPRDYIPSERERIKAIDAEIEAIQERDEPDDSEDAEAELKHLESLEAEREAIETRATQRGGTAAQRATAGVMLQLASDGTLSADLGLIPPKNDKSPRVANVRMPEPADEPQPATGAKAEPEPKKPGKALIETMDTARTAAFAQLVSERPDLAMILATAVLTATFNESPLRLTVQTRNDRESFSGNFAAVCTDLLGAGNRDAEILRTRFATAVAAIIVVRSQGSNTYQNPASSPRDTLAMAEIVASFCGGDSYPQAMRDWLDYEAYFAAATRNAIVSAVEEIEGDVAHARTLKKGELVAFAAELARDKGWLPRELRPPEALPADHPEATTIRSLADAMAEALALDGPEAEAAWNASESADVEGDEASSADVVFAVSHFLTHSCESADGAQVKAADLFAAYRSQAGTRTREATSLQAFGEAVAAYGIGKKRLKTGVHYQGIRLVATPSRETV